MKLSDARMVHDFGGVYLLWWGGKGYVGHSLDLNHRLCQWRDRFKRFLGVSPEDVEVTILFEGSDPRQLEEVESLYVAGMKTFEVGHNKTPYGGQRGRVVSEATRAKVSARMAGRPFSEAHRKKLSDAKRGRTLPEAQKAKIAASMKAHFENLNR